MDRDRLLSSYDYQLPPELIAQKPAVPRDSSRLLVVHQDHYTHSIFRDLPNWLLPGDLLVFNDTRVIPARLYGQKHTGTPVEILLLEEKSHNCWLALVKPGKRFRLGTEIIFQPKQTSTTQQLTATVIDRDPATGGRILQFHLPPEQSFWQLLEQFGHIPFPPYITEQAATAAQYQTLYAQKPGAVAAPTAGLHFTDTLLQRLSAKGINQVFITLHVGIGTFRPVEAEKITDHIMHQEWLAVSPETVTAIEKTKASGGRVIAIGTTAVRALEGAAQAVPPNTKKLLLPFEGKTDIFIYPGYRWRVIDGLVTNFHLPRSSLLMLVSALVGRERLLNLYQKAIESRYRFYSFGDAMLILLRNEKL